jgi:phospholipid/cholesterol/gamma-HCH transport system substrate-binding protein
LPREARGVGASEHLSFCVGARAPTYKSWGEDLARFTTEAKVGLVVLIGVAFLTYMTFKVGGYRFGPEEGYQIYAEFDSVAGVDLKTPVKIAGVTVGTVERIDLSDTKALLTLRIKPEVKIRKGAQTLIRSSGLLGEKYIEIINPEGEEAGTLSETPEPSDAQPSQPPSSWLVPRNLMQKMAVGFERLGPNPAYANEAEAQQPPRRDSFVKEGEVIEQKGKSADMDQLITQLNAISDDLKAVSRTLKEVLGTKEGEKSLKEIIQNIQELTRNLNNVVKENRSNLTKTVSNLEEFSKFLKESGPRLLESLNQITEKVEKGEGTLGKLVQDEEIYNRLNGALADVKQVTEKISKGEGTVGRLIFEEEAYNNVNNTLKSLGSTINRLAAMRLFVSFRNEYQFDTSDNKGYFSLRLQPQDYKYYLIEIVDEPRGRVIKTITETLPNPPETTIKTERKLRISAEFARRFWNVWIRGGLMENSFGVGSDYDLLGDHLRLSIDAWDLNSDDPEMEHARLKVTGAFSFLKYFFVQAGYDNILNKKVDTFFVGGAIRFEDDDLKYLLGGIAGGASTVFK